MDSYNGPSGRFLKAANLFRVFPSRAAPFLIVGNSFRSDFQWMGICLASARDRGRVSAP
jgi:hypothetical protein